MRMLQKSLRGRDRQPQAFPGTPGSCSGGHPRACMAHTNSQFQPPRHPFTCVEAIGIVGVVGLRLAVGAVAGHTHHHRLALSVAPNQGAACREVSSMDQGRKQSAAKGGMTQHKAGRGPGHRR